MSIKYLHDFEYLLPDTVPTLSNEAFANTGMQPSENQGRHWMTTAISRHENDFLKQHYEQTIKEPLQSIPTFAVFRR